MKNSSMAFFSNRKKNKVPQKTWQKRGLVATSSASRKERKQEGRKFSRFLFWLLFFGFLGICAYLLLFSPFLEVEKISVEGSQEVSSADMMDVATKNLEGRYLGYFPRRNFFWASRQNIKKAIEENFNRIEVESVEKKFPKSILIRVIERKAELVWCSGGVCYFVDKDGLAYGAAVIGEEELRAGNFLVVVDDSARPVEIRKTKIDTQYVTYIEVLNDLIRNDLKLEMAEGYHTPGMSSREIEGRTNEGWILKAGMEYSIEDLKKIIQLLFEKELNEEVRKKLDYLDLRVKNKIYYKIKKEEGDGSVE